MVDLTIRRNEHCIVGMPQCGHVFQATRRCFVGYGFEQSPLEVTILRRICEARGIDLVEAGTLRTPGQLVFCQKICSQIVTSLFCAIFLNADEIDGQKVPNANVNMEYGMMLAFNKYVIPFQLEEQKLPFNVAGLDTIKYSKKNFESIAEVAIDRAIKETEFVATDPHAREVNNETLHEFILSRGLHIDPGNTPGDVAAAQLARQFGFVFLTGFSGMTATFLGNFQHQRVDQVIFKLKSFSKFWEERLGSVAERVRFGLISEGQAQFMAIIHERVTYLIIVGSEQVKLQVLAAIHTHPIAKKVEIVSVDQVEKERDMTIK